MNIVKYLIEHSQTLSNIYFQQGQTVLTPPGPLITPAQATIPTVSTCSRSGLRRSSTDPELQPMKKKYRCIKCEHPPLLTKYRLAQHVSIKHKHKGVQCEICGKNMSVYHLDDHKDSHCLTNRYICEEKIKKSEEMCLKGYKQKSAMDRHLKSMHGGKSLKNAKVKIVDRDELEYESKDDYQFVEKEKNVAAEDIKQIVEDYGEEIMVE